MASEYTVGKVPGKGKWIASESPLRLEPGLCQRYLMLRKKGNAATLTGRNSQALFSSGALCLHLAVAAQQAIRPARARACADRLWRLVGGFTGAWY